jgi:hypothetical protein
MMHDHFLFLYLLFYSLSLIKVSVTSGCEMTGRRAFFFSLCFTFWAQREKRGGKVEKQFSA